MARAVYHLNPVQVEIFPPHIYTHLHIYIYTIGLDLVTAYRRSVDACELGAPMAHAGTQNLFL